ncbi:MAG: ABC transporter ATP-binding protein [Caldilinea sp.]|jgi:oligopeptide/dipeptide ABC transporter ATP-binding protein
MPLLEVDDLEAAFLFADRTVRAVNGVSFAVEAGEIVGLIGESGSGKSVTVQSILRLLPSPGRIVRGAIRLNGVNLLDLNREQMRQVRGRRIAMVVQDALAALNPVIPIGEQIADVFLAHTQVKRQTAWEKAVGMLRRVGISAAEERARHYAHEFSGGMQQRTVIAAALACTPELIIADEPTTALDVTVQQQILALLQQARSELGSAILYISHDLAVVTHLCDRILIMYAGEIVEQGPTRTLFRSPKHPYTQGLLASIPSLHGDVQEYLPAIPGLPPNAAALPTGCRFAARCTFVQERCRAHHPELVSVGSHHAVRCILYEETAP